MLRSSSTGKAPANIAGMIAKYFATSFAIENVVSEPRVISSCLPISTISISLVGFESRSTMFPASRAACVPGVHRHADVGGGERGRVVGAVAGHRDEVAALLLAADQRHLVLGLRLREEVVDARLLRDRLGGERVVAGDHHRADAHRAQLGEALAKALLDHVLQVHDTESAAVARDDERRAAAGGDAAPRSARGSSGSVPPVLLDPAARSRRRRPCGSTAAVEVDAAHARLGGERDERRPCARRAHAGRSAPSPARRSSGPRGSRRRGSRAGRRRRARAPSTPGAAGTRSPAGCRA